MSRLTTSRLALFTAAVLIATGFNAKADVSSQMDANQIKRYQLLTEELRCLVCQNQNIAESNAPLALDLRAKVEEMILAKQSDAEIKQYMTDHYGDFVLYRPPLKPATWGLWFAPIVLLLLALVVVWRVVTSRKAVSDNIAVADPTEVRRILEHQADAPENGSGREQGQ